VPIHNLMEDAATAEISRSQVWQWIRSPKGVLEDGRKVTAEMVRDMIPEELAKVKEVRGTATARAMRVRRRSSSRCRRRRSLRSS
jgi:malate synthase